MGFAKKTKFAKRFFSVANAIKKYFIFITFTKICNKAQTFSHEFSPIER
jgi:hypothetical protein